MCRGGDIPCEENAWLTASTLKDAAEMVLEGFTIKHRPAAHVSRTNCAAAGCGRGSAHAACQHEYPGTAAAA